MLLLLLLLLLLSIDRHGPNLATIMRAAFIRLGFACRASCCRFGG
jgi:hypothetical protein